jgi:hypothetical protein
MTHPRRPFGGPLSARLAAYKPLGVVALSASLLTMFFVAHDAAQAAKFESAQAQMLHPVETPKLGTDSVPTVERIDHSLMLQSTMKLDPDPSLLHSEPTAYQFPTATVTGL